MTFFKSDGRGLDLRKWWLRYASELALTGTIARLTGARRRSCHSKWHEILWELFDRVAGDSGSGAADRQNVLVVVVVLVGSYGVLTFMFCALMCFIARVSEWLFVRSLIVRSLVSISIQTAGLAFGGTCLCSYRVRGVDGSCAEHLTVESYTTVMLLTFIGYLLLLVFHHPSLLHSRLKTLLFCKSFPP